MMRSVFRVLLLLALAGAFHWAAGSSVSAHSSQLDSSPAPNSVLAVAPAQIRITFDSPLMDIGAAIVVRSTDGTVISDETPVINGQTLTVRVDPEANSGKYTVAYRIVSEDGHTLTSTFTYVLEGPAPEVPMAPSASDSTAPSAASTPEVSSTSAVWLITTGALLILALAGAVLIALRRRRPGASPGEDLH
jgi:methionine-rich copper-binding protein CopC